RKPRCLPPRRSLMAMGGALLSGIVRWRVGPTLTTAPAEWVPMEEAFWYTAGLVRQSAVSLALQPTDAAESVATAETPATGTEVQPATPTESAEPLAVGASLVIDDALEMRVAIARNAPTLQVGASSQGWLVDLNGQQRCEIPAQSSLSATPTGQGLSFNGCQLSTAVWLEAAAGGYLYIGDSWFKGRVLLLNDGGTVLAVNFVLLRDYLSSVVGSEMYPHWPLEALKAQAIAARSYALTHHVRPASDHFDLDNTQRYQAYKGVAVETTNTQIAVAATGGEFISYQGGIVESLYAASDQIVQEAHGGQGMSQTGAKDYAVQGYTYEQILGAYYPGTTLSRLVVQ
ncbi:MAG: SpoIID/LytB domain-containing protein, partial [Leptolyngbyaceae cyanobacterium]